MPPSIFRRTVSGAAGSGVLEMLRKTTWWDVLKKTHTHTYRNPIEVISRLSRYRTNSYTLIPDGDHVYYI